jgi:hypothetical protein
MTPAEQIVERMRQEWPKLEGHKLERVREIVAEVLEAAPAKKPTKRNLLLDALVEACGGDPMRTTNMAFRTAATALADIKSVEPDLTAEEIFKRARRYKHKFPGITITPSALCKFWGELSEGPAVRTMSEINRINNTPPEGWFDWLCANLPDEDAPEFGQVTAAKNMRNFMYLPESWRARCRQSCGAATAIGDVL